jgi:NodT family efflux transporter outer membrane factor (OMF) lipoprotein
MMTFILKWARRYNAMKMERIRHTIAFGATALCLAALSGCTVGPKYHLPAPAQAPPAAYKELPQSGDGWQVAQPGDAMLRGKWWEIFGDPELNALEDQLNINNQNIRQYFEQYMEARALVREARSEYFPTVTIGPSFNRQRSSSNLKNSTATNGSTGTGTGGAGVATNTGSESTLWSAPLDISWEPDLWGKIRNYVKEEQAAAQLSAADLENERLTEQASLAEYFFEIRGQDALIKVYNDTVDADKKTLAYTQSQYDTGIGDQISVVEAQNTLQTAQASATNLQVARAQYEHAIAVLVGKNASDFSIPVKPMLAAPPAIPVGMPSGLLQRRPDVAAAERTMASANATIGIGYAAFLPSLTLTADGGFEASSLKHWFDWPSRFWSVGPSFSQTVYDGGLFRAELNQYIAIYNADVASYRETILTAFQQVEDYLAAVRVYSNQIRQQQEAVKSAETYIKLEQARYDTGIDPYVDVVTAETTLLVDQQTLTTLQVEQMTASVELIQALGGGWDASQLPTNSQVTAKPTKAETTLDR